MLSAMTMTRMSPIPTSCSPARRSFKNTIPISDAVTGSISTGVQRKPNGDAQHPNGAAIEGYPEWIPVTCHQDTANPA